MEETTEEQVRKFNENQETIDKNFAIMEEMAKQSLAPVVVYSLSFDAEQLLKVYGALTTYLTILSQQESQDFETIKQVSAILIEIKPRAVEASKSLALKATGVKNAERR